MDVTATRAVTSAPLHTSVRAHELLSLFDTYRHEIKVLSLDCFDTILWRRTATPKDVFLELQKYPTFKRLGLTDVMRVKGEQQACYLKKVTQDQTQPYLHDIHRASLHNLTDAEIHALGEEELAAEMEACYGFAPMFDLIRAAHQHNIKIIVVSNTYLNKAQLLHLLKSKLPDDVMSAISDVYCSCEVGKSKTEGLFEYVLHQLNLNPAAILHVGDNRVADYESAKLYGMHALHFLQHGYQMMEIFRMQAAAMSFLDPTVHNSRALYNPFAGLFAVSIQQETPEKLIGYATLGPILYAFAQFIFSEIARLKQAGKRPKVLFMMRDGYLPALICSALNQAELGTCIELSRFAAVAASFRTEQDIFDYVSRAAVSLRFKDMAHQLLLPEKMAASLVSQLKESKDPIKEFSQFVKRPQHLKMIIENSAAYRERLKKYLQKKANMSAGDTIVMVDLGYSGTTQTTAAPFLQDEMNVEVMGLYMLAFKTYDRTSVRHAFLAEEIYGSNALKMLVTYISQFEQMCTSGGQSVVDYDEEGQPIYSDTVIQRQQIEKIKLVQAECVRFVQDAEKFLQTTSIVLNNEILRDAAAMSLGRFVYFLTHPEIQFFENFSHDVNFGAEEVLPMTDFNLGLSRLRHRSWLYSLKEDVDHMRLNYPAEFRAANLELSFVLMAQLRFNLEFTSADLTYRRQELMIVAKENNQLYQFPLEAILTHDGYYSVCVPIMPKNEIGIRFGAQYQWVELESADIIELKYLCSAAESAHTESAGSYLSAVQMTNRGGGLYECTSDAGLLAMTPPKKIVNNDFILRVIFRPIVLRS